MEKHETKDFVTLAHVLLNLHASEVMANDEEFWHHLKAITENFHNEENATKGKALLEEFIEFYRKNQGSSPTHQPKDKSLNHVRMYMDGCFDMVHSGHFNAIRQAKALTDFLVVGVISDEEIEFHKGPPVMSLAERSEIVAACKWVDEIATDNIPYNPTLPLMDKLNCQYVAHGDDLALGADGQDSYYEIKKAGRMKTFKRTDGISTTDIVGRLLLFTKQTKEDTNIIRKLSGENLLQASKVHQSVEEKKEEQAPKEKVSLIQTTRRIRQFSSGNEPKPTDKIVYVDGAWDMLHIGHVRMLKAAKACGDFLVVGIHDDEAVHEHKGLNYPILSLQERVLNILAMRDVDEVIIGAPWKVTDHLIKSLNVSLVVEGSMTKQTENENMPHHLANDPYEVPKKLGIFKQIPSTTDITTEKLIERIIENRKKLVLAHEIKKKKLENYYKTKDFTIAEA
jgi:ethanolamine-phosphate cytidylyltransferase